jgi:hypothetical protein
MPIERVKVDKYMFDIAETIFPYDNKIISHTFKIGGTYDDCIGISYTYNNNNPVSAKIGFVQYEPECSVDNNLEKGGGTAIMLKTIIQYAFKKVPSVHIFSFEDMSHIDCVEKDLSKPPPRKPVRPLSLAYLSITYNSATWYEKHFDAKMTDPTKYREYRDALDFLANKSAKVDFISFLQFAKPPEDQIEYLKGLYEKTDTYRAFFNAIPFKDRCEILRPWLKTFIEHKLGSKYSAYGWEIDALSPKVKSISGGKRSRNHKKRKTIKQGGNKKDYPSNYKVIMYNEMHSF